MLKRDGSQEKSELITNIDPEEKLAEGTMAGMHIKEEGYGAIFPKFMKYAAEPKWKG